MQLDPKPRGRSYTLEPSGGCAERQRFQGRPLRFQESVRWLQRHFLKAPPRRF